MSPSSVGSALGLAVVAICTMIITKATTAAASTGAIQNTHSCCSGFCVRPSFTAATAIPVERAGFRPAPVTG